MPRKPKHTTRRKHTRYFTVTKYGKKHRLEELTQCRDKAAAVDVLMSRAVADYRIVRMVPVFPAPSYVVYVGDKKPSKRKK